MAPRHSKHAAAHLTERKKRRLAYRFRSLSQKLPTYPKVTLGIVG